MREQPTNLIDQEAINVWRIAAFLQVLILWLLAIGGLVVTYLLGGPYIYVLIGIVLCLIFTVVFVYLIPKLRYRRWRYEIFDQEIYIQHGILVVTRTIIPMIRVQHVDTKQGPILKRYKLATVIISTAATTHEIPALNEGEASFIRDRISILARVDEDDI